MSGADNLSATVEVVDGEKTVARYVSTASTYTGGQLFPTSEGRLISLANELADGVVAGIDHVMKILLIVTMSRTEPFWQEKTEWLGHLSTAALTHDERLFARVAFVAGQVDDLQYVAIGVAEIGTRAVDGPTLAVLLEMKLDVFASLQFRHGLRVVLVLDNPGTVNVALAGSRDRIGGLCQDDTVAA